MVAWTLKIKVQTEPDSQKSAVIVPVLDISTKRRMDLFYFAFEKFRNPIYSVSMFSVHSNEEMNSASKLLL